MTDRPGHPAEPLSAPQPSLRAGTELLRALLPTLPVKPGVYRMLGKDGAPLYVGKARDIRKRVTSYTRPERLSVRIQRMVAATHALEVVTTATEAEALLLESNLIKRLKPRYNVLLRDDKSFPFLAIAADHPWPRIYKHRGARVEGHEYFGPFASAGAVNQTLAVLERAFPLRSCSDTVFSARTRPCLQYQIKRCSAPCVGRIDAAAYAEIVGEAREFLSGKSREIKERLAARMDAASEKLAYEDAAVYRDRLRALAHIQARQDVNVVEVGDADVVALATEGGQACVQVFFFRGGQNFGNRSFFPAQSQNATPEEILEAFLGQFYATHAAPKLILLSHAISNVALMSEALGIRSGHRIEIAVPERGAKKTLLEHARRNAEEALARRFAESASQRRLLEGVAEVFGLDGSPDRIEVYDNSHISGTDALGAFIVAGPEGLMKGGYRRFTIRGGATPGDDYAMMREVLTRRFARALKEDPDRSRGQWPDLVLIDGGAGQLSAACAVLADLGVQDVAIAAIAKGPDRDAGRERFFLPNREPFSLPPKDPVLYFLQRLRDEAHRFAIAGHRAKRSARIHRSALDDVPGIGSARKRALLHHFGSARGVAGAGVTDIAAVRGISRAFAQRIYDHFHSG
ncbi:MAG TPA: excinuclease ABC subunit UvrC [Alphaproteobacteria bacterium]|nr:excinuclease ABC subunit UvrC [Alphaproteobacteria bacterium]